MLVVRRQGERLTKRFERLVDGEARAESRDLEQDPGRLAEVDRAEVEAVDCGCWVGAALDRERAPGPEFIRECGPSDVVDRAGPGDPRPLRRLVVAVETTSGRTSGWNACSGLATRISRARRRMVER